VKRAIVPALGLALALGWTGCATPRTSYVLRSAPRGDLIDASLVTPSGERRFLFPRSPACAEVLAPEAPVVPERGGLWGRFRGAGGAVCEPVGIGTLHEWRKTRPEGEMAPSGAARWDVVYRDDEVFLLRGRFPLAGLVGMAGGHDLVAMVPNDATCRPVAESGHATLVYRSVGDDAYRLGRCPVLAFARP
jgi:hypothetical protein